MKDFYWRLYGKYILCKTVKNFLIVIARETKQSTIGSPHSVRDDNGVKTFIIGSKPDTNSLRNFVCLDTRSREVRHKIQDIRHKTKDVANVVIRKYESSIWQEYFISFEDELGYLYGFTRLLLPKQEETVSITWLWKDTAIIRELHIYWNMEQLKSSKVNGLKSWDKVQHSGFGKQLMDIAEKISHQAQYKKLSVISGIGVRAYYRKLGYKKVGEYMVRKI